MGRQFRRSKVFVTAGLIVVPTVILGSVVLGSIDESHETTIDRAGPSLSDAVAAGNVDLARSLLADGADPDEPRVNEFTPLMRAAIRDDESMTRLLIEAGADLEATSPADLTAWHVAAEADSAAALGVFIGAGADLSVRSRNGMSTLEHAAAAGAVHAIATIAATGVDLDTPSEIVTKGHGYPADIGSTPLGIAARAGHIEAVRTLLDLGAHVDAPSSIGQSPLLLAITSGQPPELISILLEAGADPTIRAACRSRCSYDEGDALAWARRLGDPGIIPLLEAALDAMVPARASG